MKVLRKGISLITFLIVIAGIFSGCNSKENKTFQKMQDFENAKVGVLLGSSFDILAKEYFPKADRLYFMNITDLILNLKQEKIDGILMDKGFFTPLAWEDENLSYIQMDMPATEYAVAFPKNKDSEKIKNQINEFIKTKTQNGWLEQLKEKWLSSSEPNEVFDYSTLSGTNGTLRVATSVESRPFNYLSNGRKHRISQHTIYNLQSYIEEMCVQIILPKMENPFEILVTVEYSEEKDNADVVIRYNGENFNPLLTDNELSLVLAKKATKEIVHTYDSEQKLANILKAKIH